MYTWRDTRSAGARMRKDLHETVIDAQLASTDSNFAWCRNLREVPTARNDTCDAMALQREDLPARQSDKFPVLCA